jgi:G3E family GTPase
MKVEEAVPASGASETRLRDDRAVLETGLYDEEAASLMPGWIQELNGITHTPETEEYGISSFVYRRRRPFHPDRLGDLLDSGMPGLARSKGYLWVASRPDACGVWSQAGNSVTLEQAGRWFAATPRDEWPDDKETLDWINDRWDPEVGDARQEIVIIGVDLDREATERRLDAALLNDDEMIAGPEAWTLYADFLPSWDAEEVVA